MPDSQNLQTCGCGPGCFFLLWPLFARAPRHWFLENFLLSAPGVQSVFFCCAPLGAATFRRGQSKKKTPPRVFSFLLRPRGWRSPVGSRHGARAKKKTPPRVFFFCCGPGERQGKEKPRWNGARATKKNTNQGVFFCSGPGERQGKEKPRWAPARGQSKKSFFFLLWPRAGFQRGFSFPCLSPGPEQKKNTLGGVFFFAAAPRGRSRTHCGPGWRCLPLAGAVFFFAAAPPGPGWCFFFLLWPRPDAHSLTVGWGDFGKARVVFFFFAAAPPGLFRQQQKMSGVLHRV